MQRGISVKKQQKTFRTMLFVTAYIYAILPICKNEKLDKCPIADKLLAQNQKI
jgi:hypothetical protein